MEQTPRSEREQENDNIQNITFVNTEMIRHALSGVQKAKEEFQALLEKAELGDTSVFFELGSRCMDGDGTERSPEQAVKWFRQAVDQGDPRGIEALGR